MGTTIGQELNEAYLHALTGCVIVKRLAFGFIWAHGHDRLYLLHRLSTNDLLGMSANEVKSTVLTNPIGRTVDYLTVLNFENKSLIITSPDKSDVVFQLSLIHI